MNTIFKKASYTMKTLIKKARVPILTSEKAGVKTEYYKK